MKGEKTLQIEPKWWVGGCGCVCVVEVQELWNDAAEPLQRCWNLALVNATLKERCCCFPES